MSSQPAVDRDPSEYRLTLHAQQRRRERDIECSEIAEAIRGGEIRQTDKGHLRHFVYELETADPPMYAAVDVNAGKVVTVGWKDEKAQPR